MRPRSLIARSVLTLTFATVPYLALFNAGASVIPKGLNVKDEAVLMASEGTSSGVALLPANALTVDASTGSTGINVEDETVAVPPVTIARDEAATVVKGKAWDKIALPSRKLTNNVWGAPSEEVLFTDIYIKNGNFGWSWSRQEPKTKSKLGCVQPIYPNMRIGGSPWETSKSAYFPIQLSNVKSLELDTAYNYPTIASGTYNLAFDMFLLDTNQPGSNPKLKAEVMIWIHGTKKQLPMTYKGDFSDGYNTYALYSWSMLDGRQYYSFIMKGEPQWQAQYVVDAKRLLGYLELDPDWYIHGVEIGNEIWDGSGKIEINRFKIDLNGNTL